MIASSLIVIILAIMAIIDYKTQLVPLTLQAILAIVILLSAPLVNWIMPIMIFVVLVILSKYIKGIGGADIKILLLLMVYFGYNFVLILLVSAIIGIMTILISKKKIIPFVPSILGGVVSCLVLQNYLLISNQEKSLKC